MYIYTPLQWILFFFIYCFIGWLWESSYVSVKKRRWVNRGFLHLPLLPLYGTGAVLILFVTLPFRGSLILTYLSGMVAATLLELVVGLAMEALFKVKYWDYSNQKFQYKGVICLSSSLFWGVLSIFLTDAAHRPIERLVLSLPTALLAVLDLGIGAAFVYDTVISVKAALDLAKVLSAMEKIRSEMESQVQKAREDFELQLQKAREDWEAQRQKAQERLDERLEELQLRAQKLSNGMLKRNPTATSRRYRESFAQLRQRAEEHWRGLREKRRKR